MPTHSIFVNNKVQEQTKYKFSLVMPLVVVAPPSVTWHQEGFHVPTAVVFAWLFWEYYILPAVWASKQYALKVRRKAIFLQFHRHLMNSHNSTTVIPYWLPPGTELAHTILRVCPLLLCASVSRALPSAHWSCISVHHESDGWVMVLTSPFFFSVYFRKCILIENMEHINDVWMICGSIHISMLPSILLLHRHSHEHLIGWLYHPTFSASR